MQLELKHLACYLPYGLKFISSMDKPFDELGKQPIWALNGISEMFGEYCLLTKENNDAYAIFTCKPILHPLSDLTKEIEHNGEKFVPKEKLITNNVFDWRPELIHLCSYDNVTKLLSWHFNIFGLIEKGLAIDINTLNS